MTSVVGITALQEIRKFKGFESAIIAGGFVRDSILGGSIKDLDIFIPCVNSDDFRQTVEQHFLIEAVDGPAEPTEIRIREDNFDAWLMEKENQGIDPWEKYLFDLNHENRFYIATPRDPRSTQQKKITPNIGNFKNLIFNKNGYRQISPNYIGRYDCKYMDFLDVDIVGYHVKEGLMKDFEGNIVDNFGPQLVAEFSYNIDKVYFDGENTIETTEFKRDRKSNEATLVRLNDIQSLPHAMRKFERLREKYPHIAFRSTVLEIRKEEDNSHKETYKSKYPIYSSTSTAGPWR